MSHDVGQCEADNSRPTYITRQTIIVIAEFPNDLHYLATIALILNTLSYISHEQFWSFNLVQ